MAKTPARKAREKKPPPEKAEEKLTPFERMERLTRAVIHVPKLEVQGAKRRPRN